MMGIDADCQPYRSVSGGISLRFATPENGSLAIERGEIEGNGASAWTTLKALNADWIKDKKIKIIAQWALARAMAQSKGERTA